MNTKQSLAFLLTVAAFMICYASAAVAPRRPSVENAPRFARWLISQGSWGLLATLRQTSPFGYVVSYSDAATGVPYFYLSALDPAGHDAAFDSRACFTLSERAVNDCGGADPQSPRCAKISLSGQLRELAEKSWEKDRAEKALLAEHPQFSGFPKSNGSFAVYKLDIEDIFLVNKPMRKRDITVAEYLAVQVLGDQD